MRRRVVHPITRLALAGETLLAVVAFGWAGWRGLSWSVGSGGVVGAFGIGVAGAVVLALANAALLWRAPDVAPVRSIRRLVRTTLRPLFADVSPADVVLIALAAGVGEELLFRGALQPEVGLVAASLVFGILHAGGRDTWAFGAWAAVMGGGLGALAILTGGLVAPIVAHAVYDAAAIAYLRWWPEPVE